MAILIFLSLITFSLGSYLIWPSRENVANHLNIGFAFIAYFIPAIILNVTKKYSDPLVTLYTQILTYGAISYIVGLYLGFNTKIKKTHLSFEVLTEATYEKRAIKLTRRLLIAGIIGLIISFLGMGFIPLFAADPISAKFFRGIYQIPYQRVAIIFRSSLFILSTIIPVSLIIWYKTKLNSYLWLTLMAIGLIALTLLRSLAFTGIVFAFAIIMSFKSKKHFYILICSLIGVYIISALIYLFVGVTVVENNGTSNNQISNWETISNGSPDIQDQLNFLEAFNERQEWTYGRTWYGGLIPGHYKWNPGVYTLNVILKDTNVNDIDSGGLRLPVALWGYVSFEWVGVVFVCFLSGLIKGRFVKYIKNWIQKFDSIIIRTIVFLILVNLFDSISEFYIFSMYSIPVIAILIFYMYRFKSKSYNIPVKINY